jgi:hypothetical protein
MKLILRICLVVAGISAAFTLASPTASADTFNQNRIIDDGIFDNAYSMSAGQIDNFLNGFSGSCISSNNGFKALDPIGYNPTNGYQYGGFVTAGQVIYDSAQAYGINPQVLITTLEKEQSLVTGQSNFAGYCNNGDQHKYAAAVGYGCPDSGTTYNYTGLSLYQRNGVTVTDTGTTCVNSASKAGFSQQVIRAAWLLKFGEQRSEGNIGWAVIKGNWNNSDDPQTCYGGPMTQGTFARCPSGGSAYYDGYTTIDSTSVHMDSGATAALYWYTPHFHGNQNFSSLFISWFGSPYAASYYWSYVSQGAYTNASKSNPLNAAHVSPGQRFYVEVKAKNMGGYTWYKQGSAPMRIGTDNPRDRVSGFCDSTWISCSRPAAMQEDSVAPGQTATFDFWMQAPTQAGSFDEHFNLVADGYAWLNDNGQYFTLGVDAVNKWSYVSSSAYYDANKTLSADASNIGYGQRLYLRLVAKNTGSTTWLNTGATPIRLGTALPYDRTSSFCDSTWISCARAGTLLESSVAPGQTGTFEFWVKAPNTSGTYNEYFNLLSEGNTWMNTDNGLYYTFGVNPPTYTWSYIGQGAYTDNAKTTSLNTGLTKGQRAYLTLTAKNTGNTTWYKGGSSPVRVGTSNPYGRTSSFCDSTWISCARAGTLLESSVAPGQTGTFEFWVKAPNTSGTYNEYFNPLAENTTWLNNLGLHYTLSVN